MTVERSPKELWLFTMNFPYGDREAYLENELPILAERFERIRIFPELPLDGLRNMPDNVETELLLPDPWATAGVGYLLGHPRQLLALLASLREDTRGATRSAGSSSSRELLSRVRQLMRRATEVERTLLPQYDPAKVVIYSYWTHNWATVLGLLRLRHPELRFITRAHGFDLYEHQQDRGIIPFRKFQLQQLDRLYCVSTAGLEHMRKRHPDFSAKYRLARLGTSNHGIASRSSSGPLQLASCSYVIPRKRLHLIVDALRQMKSPVHWTHFGDGPQMAALREQVATLPEHVTVDLKGNTANADLMEWYRTHPVDVFLLTSELEGGVAVVLQEAASFGIPLIATDSGGVRDIMVPETGVLLPTHPEKSMLAELLDGFRESPLATEAFRTGVRRYWETHFEAGAAFHAFCNELLQA